MEKLNEVLKTMNFSFFGSGKHKISPSRHLTENNSLFLDVRSNEEFKQGKLLKHLSKGEDEK